MPHVGTINAPPPPCSPVPSQPPPTLHQAHLKSRRDLTLAPPPAAPPAAAGGSGAAQWEAAAAEDPPFPAAALLQILRVTALILEGCSNKHLYNSYEVRQCFTFTALLVYSIPTRWSIARFIYAQIALASRLRACGKRCCLTVAALPFLVVSQ